MDIVRMQLSQVWYKARKRSTKQEWKKKEKTCFILNILPFARHPLVAKGMSSLGRIELTTQQ